MKSNGNGPAKNDAMKTNENPRGNGGLHLRFIRTYQNPM
jgi:hypothetical protein